MPSLIIVFTIGNSGHAIGITRPCVGNSGHAIRITRPCDLHFFTPHFYIVKLEFTGVFIFFLIFALKHRSWVPTIYVLSKNKNNITFFLSENYRFYNREKFQFITWVCYRNWSCQTITLRKHAHAIYSNISRL